MRQRSDPTDAARTPSESGQHRNAVTMHHVAALAEVSPKTVSNAINGYLRRRRGRGSKRRYSNSRIN